MKVRAMVPYRGDRDYLKDRLRLIERRVKRYTLHTRTREWEDEGFLERDAELEYSRATEIRGLEADILRVSSRMEAKSALSREGGHFFALDRMASKYRLSAIEVDVLLVLLLDDITISGAKTYTRGKDILGLVLGDPMAVLEARRFLYPNAPLFRHGLANTSNLDEGSVLDAYFKITERAVQEILGQAGAARLEPQALADGLDRGLHGHRVIQPQYTLADVVLPESVRGEVDNAVALLRFQDLIMDGWGFGEVFSRGGLTTLLFSGLPGTGKTMTAQAVAHELGRKVAAVNYSDLVSKWVGDTEKNIVRLFREAESCGAVLVFDEADAIFHPRVDVATATDQSFNREVNVLLQELERFSGVLILTTNRPHGLDPAFERRITLRVTFPMPDVISREGIWRKHIPKKAPLAPDVDFGKLARAFEFAGGHIKNAVLRAAVSVARRAEGGRGTIATEDLWRAADLEMATAQGPAGTRKIGFAHAAAG